MVDVHYDLLSIIYRDLLNNKFEETIRWLKYYNDSNINGVFANLYFMSEDEMKAELHPMYYQEEISVTEMFEISTNKLKELIDPSINLVFSIEGCDFIKDVKELEKLYELGLRSICLVWNEKNKYGSGVRYNGGLTDLGKIFLLKAIELGIGIDLSHTNEETFFDIVKLAAKSKDLGYMPLVYATHSNSKVLCNRIRNLSDEQLKAIKSIGGYVGIMSNKSFVDLDNENMTNDELKDSYINHIDHIGNIIGFDHIMLSTDDMTFCRDVDPVYGTRPIFNYETIREEIEKSLSSIYQKNIIDMIMYKNANNIINFLNNKCNTKKKGMK